ncbi:YidH family protein [Brachybacterium sp. YJGR34]|uniref:YidH family protein n=1 Tax=Brachybacterium sp. YJGR34 TaxID=2059911 RepID=UPI000E0AC065|nr:DUF202 domain-containing protein [Brachybacterium sp. YJGR34]
MSQVHEGVYDDGLQPERTLLAWRRTCLSFAVASLVGMRVALPTLGLPAVIVGVVCAGLAVLAYVVAATGYSRAHRALHESDALGRGGLPMILATASVLCLGVLCLYYLVSGAVRELG